MINKYPRHHKNNNQILDSKKDLNIYDKLNINKYNLLYENKFLWLIEKK